MKKRVIAFLTACLLRYAFVLPAAAADGGTQKISLCLRSDVAGCTEDDGDKLLEIRSPQVKLRAVNGIYISHAAGGSLFGARMEPGRRYTLEYALVAADGCTLPETVAEGDVELECGKGVSVVSCRIVEYYTGRRNDDGSHITERTLMIVANVVTDSTVLQRVVGWFRDLWLRIRWWQLY